MARRRPNNDDAGSLDSLLDTLTNVVGILVILLALLRVDVSTKVRQIQGVDPAATPEAVAALRATRDDLAQRLEASDRILQENDPALIQSRIDAAREELDRLVGDLAKPIAEAPNVDAMRASLEELRKQVASTQEQLDSTESDVADRRARLEKVRSPKAPPPKIVHLPNPRPAPEGARPVWFICKGNRVSVIDPDFWIAETVALIDRGAKTGPNRCDCERAAALFERADPDAPGFKLSLVIANQTPSLHVEHVDGKGTVPRQVDSPSSEFTRFLKRLDPTTRYARFLVWPDSYEAYLAARDECDKRNIAAGWEPSSGDAKWNFGLGGYHCQGYVEPPPAPAPAAPPPPAKPVPVDTLD